MMVQLQSVHVSKRDTIADLYVSGAAPGMPRWKLACISDFILPVNKDGTPMTKGAVKRFLARHGYFVAAKRIYGLCHYELEAIQRREEQLERAALRRAKDKAEELKQQAIQ
jgi:hypothetical protein